MTRQSLVLLFDSTRVDPQNFGGWPDQDDECRVAEPEIWYRMGRCGDDEEQQLRFAEWR